MDTRKQQQYKIAAILYDLGLDLQVISVMTSLSQEELSKLYQ